MLVLREIDIHKKRFDKYEFYLLLKKSPLCFRKRKSPRDFLVVSYSLMLRTSLKF